MIDDPRPWKTALTDNLRHNTITFRGVIAVWKYLRDHVVTSSTVSDNYLINAAIDWRLLYKDRSKGIVLIIAVNHRDDEHSMVASIFMGNVGNKISTVRGINPRINLIHLQCSVKLSVPDFVAFLLPYTAVEFVLINIHDSWLYTRCGWCMQHNRNISYYLFTTKMYQVPLSIAVFVAFSLPFPVGITVRDPVFSAIMRRLIRL